MSPVPLTLEDVVAPLTASEFFNLLTARQVRHLPGSKPDRFHGLLTWRSLLALIRSGEHPSNLNHFYLSLDSVMIPPEHWLAPNPKSGGNTVDVNKLVGFMAHGYSLVIQPIEPHVPALAGLCEAIRARVNDRIKAGVIVTRGPAGAFKLHYDPEDLIILQAEGRKRWWIYGPPAAMPVVGAPRDAPPPSPNLVFDRVLNPGDVLFVPAGYWHHCEAGPEHSTHLSIFFAPPTSWHAAQMLTSQLLQDAVFTTPISRLNDPAGRAALEAVVKSRMIEKINAFDLEDFLARWNTVPG